MVKEEREREKRRKKRIEEENVVKNGNVFAFFFEFAVDSR